MHPYLEFFVKGLKRLPKILDGYQHVLDDLVALIQFLDGLALRQLQQRHLGWHHPSTKVAEEWMIAKWNDVLVRRSFTEYSEESYSFQGKETLGVCADVCRKYKTGATRIIYTMVQAGALTYCCLDQT